MNNLQKILRERYSYIFLALSAIYSLVLISPPYFPYLGIATLLISLTCIVFLFKQERRKYDRFLYGSIFLLSCFLIIRANEDLFFLNILSILYLGSFLILQNRKDSNLLHLLISPLAAFVSTLFSKNMYEYHLHKSSEKPERKQKNYEQHLPGIILSGVIVLITIPLLSYANPFFADLMRNIFRIIDPNYFLKQFFGENVIVFLLRLLIFLVFVYYLPKFASAVSYKKINKENTATQILPINLFIPKIVLSVILGLFFITQIQLYTASQETLLKMGYSNSQYTREVFAQLSIVAFIIFLLLYHDRNKHIYSKILTYTLVIEALLLCGAAFKSVLDYTSQWGFTHKRLYGYASILWIVGSFSLFLMYYVKNLPQSVFVRWITMYTVLVLILINSTNFDYIIYYYAKSTTHTGTDHSYLSRLSTDAMSYKKHLTLLMNQIKKNPKYDVVSPAYLLLYRIEELQKKYKTIPPFGSINLSEYLAFQDIKDIDVDVYKNKLYQYEETIRKRNAPSESTIYKIESEPLTPQVVEYQP